MSLFLCHCFYQNNHEWPIFLSWWNNHTISIYFQALSEWQISLYSHRCLWTNLRSIFCVVSWIIITWTWLVYENWYFSEGLLVWKKDYLLHNVHRMFLMFDNTLIKKLFRHNLHPLFYKLTLPVLLLILIKIYFKLLTQRLKLLLHLSSYYLEI